MKKIVISLLSLLLFLQLGAFSQDIGKPSESKANSFLQSGELDLAKAHIDGYIAEPKNEKKLSKGKVWLTRAKVYAAIATSDNSDYQALSDNPLEEVKKSLDKVKELEKETSITYVTAFGPQEKYIALTQDFNGQFLENQLFTDLYQKGAESFDNDDLRGAINYFEDALVVKPTDTFSIMNVISAAYNLDEGPDADVIETYSRKLMDMKFRVDSTNYSGHGILSTFKLNQAGSMLSEAENAADSAAAMKVYEEAMEVLDEGLALFPDDSDLQMSSITAYIRLDKTEEAIDQLETVVKENPDKQLYFNLGILYDKLGDYEDSKKSYKKAIEMDPEYYDAYYNMGAMFFTLGNKKYAEAGEYKNMNGEYTDDKGKELEEESKVFFREAAPAFEKVVALDSSERQPFEVLQRIYWILGEQDKVDEIKEKLDAMPDAGE
ncbi:tetratricopeptide repeat protein [Chondrinema litorale]|uniref:tetratricopeptide repeat protein n=1 Tax=Chondrinema litorale TaxID=2994555 RepID=UPI002543EAF7|nr:tetratricopeptide repeat protein [Chondrinema litorale]UZR92941.1 tetratricopeptide repeat protein [Chondrinema litorale]